MFMINPFKYCTKCGKTKPATSEFWHTNGRPSLFCGTPCRACRSKRKTLEQHFWSFVERRGADDCWIWCGNINDSGYGRLNHGPRGAVEPWLAHRLSWTLHKGKIPEGLGVLHKCDNPPCVNPHHLFLGDQNVNMADMAVKGRRGKLTIQEVLRVRALRGIVPGRQLAQEHKVGEALISAIQLRRDRKYI